MFTPSAKLIIFSTIKQEAGARLWLELSPDARFLRVILSCLLVKKLFIYLALAVLGLRRSAGLSGVAASGGHPEAVMHRLLTPWLLSWSTGSGAHGLQYLQLVSLVSRLQAQLLVVPWPVGSSRIRDRT